MKKVTSILLLVAMLLTWFVPVSASTEYLPTLTILNEELPEAKAGQTITVPIQVKNNSNFLAKQIEIKPILDKDSPFMVEELIVKKEKDILSPRKVETFEFQFHVNKNVKNGVYPIPLKLNYKNSSKQPFEQTETIYIKVTSEHLPVELIVKDVSYNIEPEAGEEFDMSVEIKNSGSIAAENVFITLQSNENFLVTGNITEHMIPSISGMMSKKVNYKLTAKKGIESGLYPIKATLKYIDNYDESKIKEVEFFVPVGKDNSGKSRITLTEVKAPKSINEKQEFTVSMKVNNEGTAQAKDLHVSLSSEEDALVPLSLSKEIIDIIEAGESKDLTYKFMAKDGVKTKNYPIKITLTYKSNGKDVEVSQYVGVNVIAKGSASGTVPLMIVSDYATNPQIVNAGQEFDLALTLWNTNSEKAVQNMKVTLSVNNTSKDTNDDVFTPVDGSNTLYVAGLSPQAKSTQNLKFYTVPDAKARNYKINVAFEYEYKQNGEIVKGTSTDQIGIQVVQPAEIQVVNFNTTEAPTQTGDKGYIKVTTNNIGNVGVKNLQAKLKGDLGEETVFIGDLVSGKSHDFKFKVKPIEPGEKKGTVEISYKDTRGEIHTHTEEFTLNIMEATMKDLDLGMDVDLPIDDKESKKTFWIIIGGIGGFVLIVIIIMVRKKKKKKEMMIDEAL